MDLALRKTYRTQLTKLINIANDLMNGSTVDQTELNILIVRIKATRENLSNVNEKLIPTFKDEQIEVECEKVAEYDDAAVTSIARIEQAINKNRQIHTESPSSREQSTAAGEGLTSTRDIQQVKSVRLPKLDLLKFNGDITLWSAFWEQYRNVIHENDDLDENAKFNYLKSLLSGRAAVTINGLTSSMSCYTDAIEMLKNEFGNNERIIDNYVHQLMSLPPVKYKNDAVSLRKLYNLSLTITRSFVSLGISADQYGLMVKSVMMKSLPHTLRVEFNKRRSYEDVTSNDSNFDYKKQIDSLLKFIKVEVESLEQAQSVQSASGIEFVREKRPNGNKQPYNNVWRDVPTAAGLITNVKECCIFCKSSAHNTMNCSGSLTLSEKKDILKENKRCFRCTKPNHNSKFCKSRNVKCAKCNGRHVTSLCDPNYSRAAKDSHNNVSGVVNVIQQELSTSLIAESRIDNVCLQTACVFIKSENSSENAFIRIVLDGGSQLTFIKKSISRQLGLPVIGTHNISIMPFGNSSPSPARLCNKVSLKLYGQFSNEIIQINAIEVPEICFDSLNPPSVDDPLVRKFSMNFNLADTSASGVLRRNGIVLLIGADNYWKIVTGEQKRISDNLTAVNTKFGWTLHGSSEFYCFGVNSNLIYTLAIQSIDNENDSMDLKNFWNLETLGISKVDSTNISTMKFMENQIKFKNGRYEVTLPWKISEPKMDSNYKGALARVKTLTSRLIRDSKLIEYDSALREYFKNDCAEIAPEFAGETYYMPHKAVYRDDKVTTKIRVVFDCSAHASGFPSLNDLLSPGENLVPQLLRIILNFRVGSIGLIADIEKAFLQISLDECVRNYHSFLWYEDPISSVTKLPPLRKYRMKRVTFGVTSSPFLLAATLRKHLSEQPEELNHICDKLKKSFYVYDLVISLNRMEEAEEMYSVSKSILLSANMNLRKWCTNSVPLTNHFSKDTDSSETMKKVLGIIWYINTDELGVDLKFIIKEQETRFVTKRIALQTVARIFDPLGILGPFVIRAKILIQKIWKLKLKWDGILPEEILNMWLRWCSEISCLTGFVIPRSVSRYPQNAFDLHVFADASPLAYGVVAYIRTSSLNDVSFCEILMAKNRVAPINEKGDKSLTVPKLELTAALCATRLLKYIIDNLDVEIIDTFLWSDSKIALHWIKGSRRKKWQPYISNRVTEILSISTGSWRYCPGSENPADLVTRGIKAEELSCSELWIHGPEWLIGNIKSWPNDDIQVCPKEVSVFLMNIEGNSSEMNPIFSLERFSNLEKILKITAYIKRFLYNVKHSNDRKTGYLTVAEMKDGENYWIRLTQREGFRSEINALSRGKLLESNSSILTLNPFLDSDSVIRLGGRLQEACLPFDNKHPIILPKKSLFTEKIIWNSHFRTGHGGINATLAYSRNKYWVIQGKQRIKSIIGKCVACKKMKGKPSNEPFAPLPKNRITVAHPFKITGVDFAGPFYIKKKRTKVYLLLFTCAVIRAVHLELVPDLTTESCMRGLRRFIGRRGVPNTIYSDNARTFKRVCLELQELSKILQNSEVQNFARSMRIEWQFIVERASWWGGWWERLIRTIKTALKFVIGKASLEYDELSTVLVEVEAIVNSRPLTYLDDDPENLTILSPSRFLTDTCMMGFSSDVTNMGIMRSDILKLWKSREQWITKLWKTWKSDYLQQLRSFHHSSRITSRNLKIGDVALLHDQNLPRLLWKLVRIVDVFPGKDGRIRACELKTADGVRLKRPIQLIYPLEVDVLAGENVEKA